MKKKLLFMVSVVVITLLLSGISVNAGYKKVSNVDTSVPQKLNRDEIYNITVYEAYDLVTNTSNGIQNIIDVRYDYEWYSGFIDAPYPENTHWYCLDLLKNETHLQTFLDTYAGKEVIMQCKGGYRSLVASYILLNANFTGKIYNMLGGIMAWEAEGLPIRNNTPPSAPDIDGPTTVTVNKPRDYTLSTIDDEEDIVYYWIEWCNDTTPEWIGPYESGEEVVISNSWCHEGVHTVRAKTKDFYGNESGWSELTVTVPRSKQYNINLLNWLLDQVPLLKIIFHRLGLN
jgi:rhodanese-related sulfurtransferase